MIYYNAAVEIRKLVLDDPTFPAVLKDIPTPPQQLYVQGELSPLLSRPRLGVVGTRKVSPYGFKVTRDMVTQLVARGVVIVSGLALGVDSVAHQATIGAGGQTIAVLGGGLDEITPRTNKHLAKLILERQGTILSEYPLGQKPFRYSFVQRNRLIAGLSDALLVTEAALNSGTRHTVQFALAQNKDILAVPGEIDSEGSKGTNQLIRDGALIVTEVDDILQAIGLNAQPSQLELFGDNEEETTILRAIQKGHKFNGDLMTLTGLNISQLLVALSRLEIAGRITSPTGNSWELS